jgi:hypothetical protein
MPAVRPESRSRSQRRMGRVMSEAQVFCAACGQHPRAEIRIEDGFPVTKRTDPHRSDLDAALDRLEEAAGGPSRSR